MSKRAEELAVEVPMIWPGTLAETIADWRQHITALVDAELRKERERAADIAIAEYDKCHSRTQMRAAILADEED